MKKIFFITIILGSLSSCQEEFTETLVGVWTESEHLINGSPSGGSSVIGKTISFSSNNTYTSEFTYPWHCEPCASSADSGTWSYDEDNSTLTLISTKNQTEYCTSMMADATHDNATQIMNVVSSETNELVVQFLDVNCSQDVSITFIK